MLFNSHIFILVFLPLTLLGYAVAGRFGRKYSEAFLVAASFVFYASWSFEYGLLIVCQLIVNFLTGRAIAHVKPRDLRTARRIMVATVAGNAALLIYFKYTNFVLGNIYDILGRDFTTLHIILPLAISFHTFQQISYIVDEYKGDVPRYGFIEYCLFVLFFPQLIAGPIVRHGELIGQLRNMPLRLESRNMVEGILFFVMGLAKKVLLADPLSDIADPVFAGLVSQPPDMALALVGTLAFGLGLYFDFSGYSDMAIGLSRMFGVRLPYNFSSPYRSLSIVDFWRRWHMTLSRWLRDYIYIPLGGSRGGAVARQRNLMATMLIGGIWHGASWNFVIWGGLHGLFLAINHGWRTLGQSAGWKMPRPVAWALTFAAVMTAWVFFKAATFDDAVTMLQALGGHHGGFGERARVFLSFPADTFAFASFGFFWEWARLSYHEGSHLIVLAPAFLIVLVPLNTQDLVDGRRLEAAVATSNAFRWDPLERLAHLKLHRTPAMGVAMALLALFAMTRLSDVKEFVYFQF